MAIRSVSGTTIYIEAACDTCGHSETVTVPMIDYLIGKRAAGWYVSNYDKAYPNGTILICEGCLSNPQEI